MSEQTTEEIEREEIEMLLPWYATGRLDRADVAKVESYLARHPQMSAQLDLIRAERDETVLANEVLGRPPSAALDRLMASLPAAWPGLAQRIASSALLQRVRDFFTAPTARDVQWAALAAAALIVVQAAAITSLMVGGGGDSYHTASGQKIGGDGFGSGVSALVVFADDAKASAIARLLTEFDASFVDGPKPGGVYKIRLRTADRSQSAQDALLRRLAERRDILRTVLPSRN
jgi:anti-sigma factor RsiW